MGVVMMEWVGPGEKGVRAGDRTEVVEEEVSSRFSFSLSPDEEELPMLARETRPFLLKKTNTCTSLPNYRYR
jgi:hypothetical protein